MKNFNDAVEETLEKIEIVPDGEVKASSEKILERNKLVYEELAK